MQRFRRRSRWKEVRQMRTIAVALGEEELIRLRRILTDEDREEALSFLKEVLEPKVKESELPHCVPFFESSYKPNQAEAFGEPKGRGERG